MTCWPHLFSAAFTECDEIIEGEVEIGSQYHFYMETHVSLYRAWNWKSFLHGHARTTCWEIILLIHEILHLFGWFAGLCIDCRVLYCIHQVGEISAMSKCLVFSSCPLDKNLTKGTCPGRFLLISGQQTTHIFEPCFIQYIINSSQDFALMKCTKQNYYISLMLKLVLETANTAWKCCNSPLNYIQTI